LKILRKKASTSLSSFSNGGEGVKRVLAGKIKKKREVSRPCLTKRGKKEREAGGKIRKRPEGNGKRRHTVLLGLT